MERIEIEFIWIPRQFGGFNRPPTPGLRPGIRWQHHIEESLEYHRSVIMESVHYEATTLTGRAVLRPYTPEIPEQWLEPGQAIELLDGIRVIAVGVIKGAPRSSDGSPDA